MNNFDALCNGNFLHIINIYKTVYYFITKQTFLEILVFNYVFSFYYINIMCNLLCEAKILLEVYEISCKMLIFI